MQAGHLSPQRPTNLEHIMGDMADYFIECQLDEWVARQNRPTSTRTKAEYAQMFAERDERINSNMRKLSLKQVLKRAKKYEAD